MKKIVIKLIEFYRKKISPVNKLGFGGAVIECRFYPSCSEYSIEAIKKHGLFFGFLKSGLRLLKCGPWSKGGVDFP